jgi:nucleotide-binding universal stress UspA family protein
MSFAALMVHFDGGANSHHRLRLAVDLANRFEATLIGIAGRVYLPPFLADGNGAPRKNGEQQEMTAVLADIGKKFRAAAKHVTHVEWRGISDDASNLVASESRAADLVIIGQAQDSDLPYYALDPGITIVRAAVRFWSCPRESTHFKPGASS